MPQPALPRFSVLRTAGALARWADRLLTALLTVVLVLVFLYASFALWDTWRIYDAAGVDETLLRYKPQTEGEDSAGFAELRALNPDVCAWLTVDDTNIDYPVLQAEDNVKYVNTDVYGDFSLSGSVFLDYRNAADFTDPYSLLYGHHMEGEIMFGGLQNFAEQSYFAQHTSGTLYLPHGALQIEWFACLQTDAYDEQAFGAGDMTGAELDAWLEQLRGAAVQYRDIGVTGQDRILALSTCSDASTNARTILLGRLQDSFDTEGGESK